MDPRDIALQATMPTVMVPLYGQFVPLDKPGNRILVAKDGMWIEAYRPGIYSRQRLVKQPHVSVPYGAVAESFEPKFSHLGKYVREFVAIARQAFPYEVGMALIWDDTTETLESRPLGTINAGTGYLRYVRPELQQGQHVVVDIHSHGKHDAYFSRLDDDDDKADLKVAIVIGNVDEIRPTVVARLCTLGNYRPLSISIPESEGRVNTGETAYVPAYAQ